MAAQLILTEIGVRRVAVARPHRYVARSIGVGANARQGNRSYTDKDLLRLM
jgi:hypothetical protein